MKYEGKNACGGSHVYCFITMISTLRLRSLLLSVVFSYRGSAAPTPKVCTRELSMPCCTNHFFTASARWFDSSTRALPSPMLSVWPMIIISRLRLTFMEVVKAFSALSDLGRNMDLDLAK